MSDAPPSSADLLRELASHKSEIATLTAELAATPARVKLHAKRVMKQGMDDYFSGKSTCPYATDSDDADLWSFGYNLSKDNWNDVRNPTDG